MVDSYAVKFDIDIGKNPCKAIVQLKDEMVRFSNSFFTNEKACERPLKRITKVRESAFLLDFYHIIYMKVVEMFNFKINWRMGNWESNLARKLKKNSVPCTQENSTTIKPTPNKTTTLEAVKTTTPKTTTQRTTTQKTTTQRTTTPQTTRSETPKTQTTENPAAGTPANIGQSFCSDKIDGHYSHDKSCGRFFQCANGQKFDMPCPAGLHFNPKIEVCDWPSAAGCTLE